MLNAITHSSVFVLDQDEALEFYVGKLGFEVVDDVDLGFMRWLTVALPNDPGRQILLEQPGVPAVDEKAVEQIRDLLTKGALGLAFIITTDDVRKTHAELKEKGVEFTDEPTEHFYGIDCGLRDPFGNQGRLTQPVDHPKVPQNPGEEFTAPKA